MATYRACRECGRAFVSLESGLAGEFCSACKENIIRRSQQRIPFHYFMLFLVVVIVLTWLLSYW